MIGFDDISQMNITGNYRLILMLQVGVSWRTIKLYPFILHSISLSLFASVIGPFGGFFASGFKRAFKIKVICCTLGLFKF